MPQHSATIVWQRDAQPFTDHRYSRRHSWHFDGGAQVAASSSPHVVRLPFSDPSAVDPEEAFIAALSSCHMLWFLDLAARAGWVVDSYRDAATGLMARNSQGRMAMAQVTLHPAVQFGGDRQPSRAELEQLHHAAHAECYIANSVTTEVLCEPVF
ncbi:organic hydroperoxide reductase OsmC/OhrA [Rhodoferax ferrireducens]|uniref:Organic hydroperoxide reductase OsmC/OhrA n=1 Tax=Rhodoferax ferrireducens TaxID=192843 RepID=A0ABU2CCZ5_9BURK|nr:OsmC family protein [Rhodoferax ferrireducens]MDR7379207.1 organic hydroperoxide reductase OsmC/OhrA [Rhodoferax ferrireducens]